MEYFLTLREGGGGGSQLFGLLDRTVEQEQMTLPSSCPNRIPPICRGGLGVECSTQGFALEAIRIRIPLPHTHPVIWSHPLSLIFQGLSWPGHLRFY